MLPFALEEDVLFNLLQDNLSMPVFAPAGDTISLYQGIPKSLKIQFVNKGQLITTQVWTARVHLYTEFFQ